MSEIYLIFVFMALMAVNVLASLIYFTSFRDLRSVFRRKLR